MGTDRYDDVAREQCAVHDFDGDGDVYAWSHLDDYWRNQGDGTYQRKVLGLPAPPVGFQRAGPGYPAGWDGDGDLDILVPLGSHQNVRDLELLTNLGDARFLSEGRVASSSSFELFTSDTRGAIAADMDQDGDLDLILRTIGWVPIHNRSQWWRNDGSGRFSEVEEFDRRRVEYAVDLTGDGIVDLLSTGGHPSVTAVEIAVGLGAGTFAPWPEIPGTRVRASRDHFAVGDMDADGDLDIGAVSSETGQAQVFWSDSFGQFVGEQVGTAGAGHGTESLFAADDLNGDGLLDLVFGPSLAQNSLAVRLRSADNTEFLSSEYFPMLREETVFGIWHTDFEFADLDGDGDSSILSNQLFGGMTFQGDDAGSRRQRSDAEPGTRGVEPTLGAVGPFRAGESVELRLRGVRPGASGFLEVSYTRGSGGVFGEQSPLLRRIPFTVSGSPADRAGTGNWEYGFDVQPGAHVGRTLSFQATIIDPGSSTGKARSNTLDLTFRP